MNGIRSSVGAITGSKLEPANLSATKKAGLRRLFS